MGRRSNKERNRLLEEALLILLAGAIAVVIMALSGCERRELYVYGDEFHSVQLDVDWRDYASSDPGGMTTWFYPADGSRAPYCYTTAEVRSYKLYLPKGRYEGVVVDYSPDEYSRQEFLDMDSYDHARVRATEASYQPDSLAGLYGADAYALPLPDVNNATSLYVVRNQPEEMALDTLSGMTVLPGLYGDYVPWRERETYQQQLFVTDFSAVPRSLLWRFRVRVFVRGIYYLYQTTGSLAGLADGHYLARHENTDRPCLVSIDDWEVQQTGDNEGYVAATITTFGLRPSTLASSVRTRADGGEAVSAAPEELRLNIRFLLRDRETALTYHFDIGHHLVSFGDEQVLRLDLGEDDYGDVGPDPMPDLPYADPYNGAGFDATVEPWHEEDPIDIEM